MTKQNANLFQLLFFDTTITSKFNLAVFFKKASQWQQPRFQQNRMCRIWNVSSHAGAGLLHKLFSFRGRVCSAGWRLVTARYFIGPVPRRLWKLRETLFRAWQSFPLTVPGKLSGPIITGALEKRARRRIILGRWWFASRDHLRACKGLSYYLQSKISTDKNCFRFAARHQKFRTTSGVT